MNKFIVTLFLTFVSMILTNTHAWGGFQSQKVNGFSRYCTYSDGGVLTVRSTDLCPIDNSNGSQNNESPTINIENRNVGFGLFTDQRVNGFNRYCSYSDGAVLTVGSTDLWPIINK